MLEGQAPLPAPLPRWQWASLAPPFHFFLDNALTSCYFLKVSCLKGFEGETAKPLPRTPHRASPLLAAGWLGPLDCPNCEPSIWKLLLLPPLANQPGINTYHAATNISRGINTYVFIRLKVLCNPRLRFGAIFFRYRPLASSAPKNFSRKETSHGRHAQRP